MVVPGEFFHTFLLHFRVPPFNLRAFTFHVSLSLSLCCSFSFYLIIYYSPSLQSTSQSENKKNLAFKVLGPRGLHAIFHSPLTLRYLARCLIHLVLWCVNQRFSTVFFSPLLSFSSFVTLCLREGGRASVALSCFPVVLWRIYLVRGKKK